MRASYLPISFHQKRGPTVRGWVQNSPFSLFWMKRYPLNRTRHHCKYGLICRSVWDIVNYASCILEFLVLPILSNLKSPSGSVLLSPQPWAIVRLHWRDDPTVPTTPNLCHVFPIRHPYFVPCLLFFPKYSSVWHHSWPFDIKLTKTLACNGANLRSKGWIWS